MIGDISPRRVVNITDDEWVAFEIRRGSVNSYAAVGAVKSDATGDTNGQK